MKDQFLLIRTSEGEPVVARYVQSETRAWEIIRKEIAGLATEEIVLNHGVGELNDSGIANMIDENVTEYPNGAVMEFRYTPTVRWWIINVNDIKTVE